MLVTLVLMVLMALVAPASAQTALVRVADPGEAPELDCDSLRPGAAPQGAAAAPAPLVAEWLAHEKPARDARAASAADAAGPARAPRIALWGDSHTAAGPFVGSLLEAWGLQRARTRPSFIPASFGQAHVQLPLHKTCIAGAWRLRAAYRRPVARARFAKGLVALSSEAAGSALAFDFRDPTPDTRLQWLDVVYSKDDPERVLVLALRVNGGAEQVLFLHGAGAPRLRVLADVPLATLHLRVVAGQMNLEGLAPVYIDGRGAAVIDVFSVPGATVAGWQSVDTRYLASREADPVDYDLVLFQYGTNDAVGERFDADAFERSMRAALMRLREVYPAARCAVIGPPDRGSTSKRRGESRRLSLTHVLVADVQERLAREFSCSFWNWQAAMGGVGAALRWSQRQPALMRSDLIHLSAGGYTLSAQLLARALPLEQRK